MSQPLKKLCFPSERVNRFQEVHEAINRFRNTGSNNKEREACIKMIHLRLERRPFWKKGVLWNQATFFMTLFKNKNSYHNTQQPETQTIRDAGGVSLEANAWKFHENENSVRERKRKKKKQCYFSRFLQIGWIRNQED
ncbi:hypothetical protein PIB30_036028 [Stylosanthes scabra]|uniref:Uncharacterized protein n=1 Tax=Stylosanthes scabra TaxID=79078 RepID=A0ABU6XB05_9FABA|nr:hypothetical protein [Stylosanthes scabra]